MEVENEEKENGLRKNVILEEINDTYTDIENILASSVNQ